MVGGDVLNSVGALQAFSTPQLIRAQILSWTSNRELASPLKPMRPRILGAGVVRDGVAALAWLLRGRRGGSALAKPFLKDASAALLAEEIETRPT